MVRQGRWYRAETSSISVPILAIRCRCFGAHFSARSVLRKAMLTCLTCLGGCKIPQNIFDADQIRFDFLFSVWHSPTTSRKVEPTIVCLEESLRLSSMGKRANSKTRQGPPAVLPQLGVFFSRVEVVTDIAANGETWGLVWNKRRGRRQTIVLIGWLSQDRLWRDYRKNLDNLKREAQKVGCTRLTDALDIVKIKPDRNRNDPDLWWLSLFDNSDIASDTDQYQWIRFGRNSKGEAINYQFCSANLPSDTELSLILDVSNNCNSIVTIVQSGKIPKTTLPNPSTSVISNEHDTAMDDSAKSSIFLSPLSLWRQTFLSNNSITILRIGKLHSANQSSIAVIRCIRAFSALWNNRVISATNESAQTEVSSIIPSQIELSKERIDKWNVFLSSLVDMMLGIGVAAGLIYLLHNPHSLGQAVNLNLSVKTRAFHYLEDRIAWLETFPAGFKLNVQLTHTMGRGIRSLLDSYKDILLATFWDPEVCRKFLVPSLAAIAGLGGWASFLALVLDLWRLEIIHVTVLAVCFRKLYQAELYLLSALFRLFRGKKRNILRQRTDSMKYDAMQLLVGTIAFCVCVFLWTTVMVYYTFFLIWNLSMHLPLMGCSVTYLLSHSFPFGSLLFRVMKPHWFPKDLYIQAKDEIIIQQNPDVSIQVGNLVAILEPPGSILSGRISGPLKRLFNWYLASFLEIVYPRSSHRSHSFLPSSLLVSDSKL